MPDIVIAGATYLDAPAIDVPKSGGGTARFVDPSPTTAIASDVATGKYFLDSSGVLTAGTSSGSGSAISIVDEPDSHGGTIRHITGVTLSGDTVSAAHLESGYTAHDSGGNAIQGALVIVTYYTGSTAPSSSLGEDGDIYLQT